jgi:acyl dehydratase
MDVPTITKVAVGDRATRTRRVEVADIERFTAMTGDRNPLHYDDEAALASRFGGIIVPGGVTTGLLNALVAEDLPGPGSVFLHVSWDFLAPARPGDVLTAEAVVTTVHATKPVCTMRTTIVNQRGDVVVDGSVVVFREHLIR